MARRKKDQNGSASNRAPIANYIDRLVELEEEAREKRLELRELYNEAKENTGELKGAIRIIVKEKLETEEQRANREAIEAAADQMRAALGMLRGTPLGDAAEQELDA